MDTKVVNSDIRREIVRNARFMDDVFVRVALNDNIPDVELILSILLNDKKLKVKTAKTQESIESFGNKSIVLDIYAEDENGKVYNIEIQRANSGAIPKRARLHAGILDSRFLKPGEHPKDLPETYVIFITESDIFKGNKDIYHIDKVIRETGETFEDDLHIVYVNMSTNADTEIGKLMNDFRAKDATEMNNYQLAETMRLFKEGSKVDSMFRSVDSILEEYGEDIKLEAKLEGKVEILYTEVGLTAEQIATKLNLSVLEVHDIINKLN
jgi:predicted transposase/invertase (TIGR01784 family)